MLAGCKKGSRERKKKTEPFFGANRMAHRNDKVKTALKEPQ
jgi:hypothetical protein